MSHNNIIYVPHPSKPVNGDQIRVNGRLLYRFVADGYGNFEEWADSLRCMADDPSNSMMGYQVWDIGSKDMDLNLNLAMFLIIGSSHRAIGAVARVILSEGLQAAAKGDIDYINQTLENYLSIGKYVDYVYALALYAFLRVGGKYDDWFHGQEKSLRIRSGSDYIRIIAGRRHRRKDGRGEIYLENWTAKRMIMATQTPRGILASMYLQPLTPGSFGL